jgi:hypothetical protein
MGYDGAMMDHDRPTNEGRDLAGRREETGYWMLTPTLMLMLRFWHCWQGRGQGKGQGKGRVRCKAGEGLGPGLACLRNERDHCEHCDHCVTCRMELGGSSATG